MAKSSSFHGNEYGSNKGGTVGNGVFYAVHAKAV
jgi:hypothetical protein